jgi:hypothetical protein
MPPPSQAVRVLVAIVLLCVIAYLVRTLVRSPEGRTGAPITVEPLRSPIYGIVPDWVSTFGAGIGATPLATSAEEMSALTNIPELVPAIGIAVFTAPELPERLWAAIEPRLQALSYQTDSRIQLPGGGSIGLLESQALLTKQPSAAVVSFIVANLNFLPPHLALVNLKSRVPTEQTLIILRFMPPNY